jgi:MGT family glycosyltransferase
MAHFAVIGPPLRGHYKPLSHLARELLQRGHEVTFIHHPDAEALVEAPGAKFVAIGAEAPPVSRWTLPMAKIRGIIGLGGMMDGMVRFTAMFCREAPEVIRRIGADALIVDQLEAGGGLVAEHLGLPYASIADTMPINREEGVPPPYVAWPYDPSEKGLKRNRGGWRVTDLLLRKVGKAIEANARMLGLPPRRRLEDCLSPTLQISQMVPGIDFPRRELPSTFHYTGPFRHGAPESFDVPAGDDRPLVYCALGTLQGQRVELFRKVAQACAGLDLRLLLTQGGLSGVKRAEKLPGDPLVYDWVSQEGVLQHADLIVCHGGINTVLEPLAAGVPMVLMPLAFEQGAIAARMDYAGVARVLSFRSSASKLAEAIREVRRNPEFRNRARAIQQEMRDAGGVRRAADLIEATPGVSAPRASATRARKAPNGARGGSRSGSSSAGTRAS